MLAFKKLWRIAVSALVLAACTTVPAITNGRTVFKDAEQSWSHYESDNFTLISDVSYAEAVTFLEELEDFRRFIRAELNPEGGVRPRLTIIAPSTRRGFSAFADPDELGGLYFRTIDTDFMIINLSATPQSTKSFNGDFTATDILHHEYTHAVIADMPGKPFPLWLNEGLAEYYATARRDGDEYVIGTALPGRVKDLLSEKSLSRQRSRRLTLQTFGRVRNRRPATSFLILAPLHEIVNANAVSDVYANRGDQTNFHAQAWLLTHQLYRSEEGRALINDYLAARNGFGQDAVRLQLTLNQRLDDFDDILWDVAAEVDFPSRRVTAPPRPEVKVRRISSVSEAEMWCNIGRFRGFYTEAKEAKAALRHAIRLDPANVCALSHLSKLQSWDFELEEAEALTARAEALNSTDPFTPLSRSMLAYNLVRLSDKAEEIDEAALDEGIYWARQTIEMDPRIALSYVVHAALVERKPRADYKELCAALASSIEAERLTPQDPTAHLLTGLLHRRLHEIDEAYERLSFVSAWSPYESHRRIAEHHASLLAGLLETHDEQEEVEAISAEPSHVCETSKEGEEFTPQQVRGHRGGSQTAVRDTQE